MTAPGTTCVACSGDAVFPILTIDRSPVLCNQLCHTRDEALAAPVAAIDLAHCRSCGHVFNAAFDPGRIEYGPDYENALHFSPRFRAYSAELVEQLGKRHELEARNVIEIGCGDGSFLRELCTATGAHGHGFDPGYSGAPNVADHVHCSSESFFDSRDVPDAALVCCRHVLEHVEQPRGFMATIAGNLGAGTALYLEVPNALYTLRDLGIWDIIYEHPSYFCVESLRQVVSAAGFAELDAHEAFGGQFLGLHAKLDGATASEQPPQAFLAEVSELVANFASAYRSKVDQLKSMLATARSADRRVAVWGAGSKGSTFLNVVDADAAVACVVDVNPSKRGKFVAGTGHPIVAPDDLRDEPVDFVVLMNPIYEDEVRANLQTVCPGATLELA